MPFQKIRTIEDVRRQMEWQWPSIIDSHTTHRPYIPSNPPPPRKQHRRSFKLNIASIPAEGLVNQTLNPPPQLCQYLSHPITAVSVSFSLFWCISPPFPCTLRAFGRGWGGGYQTRIPQRPLLSPFPPGRRRLHPP